MFYGNLQKLVELLEPDYIIHTGDMVDNIKLELYPFRINEYKKSLGKLGRILCQHSKTKVFIAAGNHDDINLVSGIFPNAELTTETSKITIEGNTFEISHYAPLDLTGEKEVSISFFGHDLSMNSQTINNKTYLNGIEHINIIELDTLKKIVQLEYPAGTNDSRLNRRKKIGM